MIRFGPFISLVFILSACASVRHVSVPQADDDVQGIRYYESSPYLLIYSDSMGGIKTKILYLPDQTRLISARPKSKFAKLKTTLLFENGVLTSSAETVDTTALPSAVLSALEKVLPLLAASARQDQEIPGPYLFKIVVHSDEVKFYGSNERAAPIRVKLSAKSTDN